MFNWYIDLALILLSNILLLHTMFTSSTNNFFITDIKIAHQNKLLRLVKTTGLSGTSSGVGMDIVDCGNLLREYEISKILNIECIVKDVTNGNEHWKRPLLIRNENIKLILRINVENRIDEYSIYFKYNEDCYDKISEIKFNITTAFAKTIKGNPKIEGNKVITKNRIYVFNINGICNDNCNIEVYSNKPDIAIKYNVRSITTLQGHQYLVSENGKTIPTK